LKPAANIVWFKRDLRLHDHAPLCEALQAQLPVLLVYLFEPELMQLPDWDIRHERFVVESLDDMRQALQAHHMHLHLCCGTPEQVFGYLAQHWQLHTVYAHQEIGNAATFARDKRMKKWFHQRGIQWKEYATNGIIRGLRTRDGWNQNWERTMSQPWYNPQWTAHTAACVVQELPLELQWQRRPEHNRSPLFQPGGESKAIKYLESFQNERVKNYSRHISKPTEARTSCSRLSPYLAWGNLSVKQVVQSCTVAAAANGQKKNMNFFLTRMHWHCHFIQKFESEPRIEFENLNSGFNGIRQEINEAHLEAWKQGLTGFPLIDAAMRCLRDTGYLNFRMRSMLVSFLTHHLWLPWQSGAHHLARYFLDYEPGIHYSQLQMQAGTMGVNTLRIYNPVKQSLDHDPDGAFIRKWVPELAQVPAAHVHEPWKMTALERTAYHLDHWQYPAPIIHLKEAAAHAREQLWGVKRSDAVKKEVPAILQKHTHRKSDSELKF
jgi:deoxyribodipyrimidine photo-lyase